MALAAASAKWITLMAARSDRRKTLWTKRAIKRDRADRLMAALLRAAALTMAAKEAADAVPA
jgi:hypothetical protein